MSLKLQKETKMSKRNIKEKLKSIYKVIERSSQSKNKQSNEADSILVLISAVLCANGEHSKRDIDYAVSCLVEDFSMHDNTELREKLSVKYSEKDIANAAAELSSLNTSEKETIVLNLIEIASYQKGEPQKIHSIIELISKEFSISEAIMKELYNKGAFKTKQRTKVFNSAAGLLMAIVIIILFLLAVTYLKSVVFGLILACFFLPLQDWYKRRIIISTPIRFISNIIKLIFLPISYPLNKIKKAILHSQGKYTVNRKSEELKYINYSCHLTLLSLIFFIFIAFYGISWLSTTSFSSLTDSATSWVNKTTFEYEVNKQIKLGISKEDAIKNVKEDKHIEGEKETGLHKFFEAIIFKIESLKPAIENSKFFKPIKEWVVNYIRQNESKGDFQSLLLSKTGGIFSLTAGAVSSVVSFLMNLIFTLFFFTFFLHQMARLHHKLNNKVSYGQYIVRGVFSSGWFPDINKDTFKSTVIIIDGILEKLNAWVKGYLSVIIIDCTYYITTFLLAGVPYAVWLGFLAGITILVPYIGPVLSCILTLSVCLVFGTGGTVQILIIIILYLFWNGLMEQFFIYPALVGGRLGLSEFETIIIVLLGGILAGITGLIFAVPIASILKYLIPKVYVLIDQGRMKLK